MLKKILLLLGMVLILLSDNPINGSAETDHKSSEKNDLSTLQTLSEDVLRGLKQIKIGLRWLSVNELARYG